MVWGACQVAAWVMRQIHRNLKMSKSHLSDLGATSLFDRCCERLSVLSRLTKHALDAYVQAELLTHHCIHAE